MEKHERMLSKDSTTDFFLKLKILRQFKSPPIPTHRYSKLNMKFGLHLNANTACENDVNVK